ncbi:MAG TPA: VOC family protein [Bacteroidia bacterium]
MNTTAIAPYLNFNGNAREAMTFYKECLGGELTIMDFDNGTPGVMHANLYSGDIVIFASDCPPGTPAITFGTSVSLSINCMSREQVDKFFNALSKGGNIIMPLEDTFWGAYFGMLTDKFGIHWMFNYDDPAKAQKH